MFFIIIRKKVVPLQPETQENQTLKMHRIIALTAILFIMSTAMAAPVDVKTARIAGTHFLQQKGLIETGDTLS